jgi:hypothetical protein
MECYKNLKTDRSVFIEKYLIENYSVKSKNEIIDELDLSWNYIQRMAHYFRIKREFNDSPRTLIKLLDLDDNITCYWIGFLLADGHISKHDTISVNLNLKDKDYFEQIEKHLNIKLKPSYVDKLNAIRYSLCDRQTILKIKKIFDWKTNKTKEIPKIPKLNENQIFSLIIGFIDGDGSISKNGGSLKIVCDASWKNILEYFYEILTNEYKYFKLTSNNCCQIRITKIKLLEQIKNKAKLLNLPIMKRKWDRIIDGRILKNDKYLIVKKLFNENKSVDDIISETGFSRSLIYKVRSDLDIVKRRLDKDFIIMIREYYNSNKYSQIELSKMFNIKPGNINKIVTYKTWKKI